MLPHVSDSDEAALEAFATMEDRLRQIHELWAEIPPGKNDERNRLSRDNGEPERHPTQHSS